MAALMSKRQQARNERDLQTLISSVTGNDRCADCQARNPGWASWSLGIFLCMRCAALHRKLGTHISKVKSLSMDTWSSDQVETMRQNGNASINQIYNPRSIKPGIPLDIDEVDSAMERFIRQKYQERSLADGKPKLPSRDEISPRVKSPRPSPSNEIQPPKKSRIFGFKLRASSSAYPDSKRDTRDLPPLPPTTENAFYTEVHSKKSPKPRPSETSNSQQSVDEKLSALREMGFPDDKRNSAVLQRLSGDLGRTVESLVRLGEGNGPDSARATPIGSQAGIPSKASFLENVKGLSGSDGGKSTNRFDPPRHAQNSTVPHASRPQPSYNPFDSRAESQDSLHSMGQALQAMQITSQPLFPHSTGGCPRPQPAVQDLRFQHSMTPPVPQVPQRVECNASPSITWSLNPFLQPPPVHNSGDLDSSLRNAPYSAPPTNPFFNQSPYQSVQSPPQSLPLRSHGSASNLIPAASQNRPAQPPQSSPFMGTHQPLASPSNIGEPAQTQPDPQFQSPSSSLMPWVPSQASWVTNQQSPNPYSSYSQAQSSPQRQAPQSQLQPQPTGRFDKNSILALYDYPHLAPQPMPTIPDGGAAPTSPASIPPAGIPVPAAKYDMASHPPRSPVATRRSATMPVSSPTAGGSESGPRGSTGTKNPFLNISNTNTNISDDIPNRQPDSQVTSPVLAQSSATPASANSIMHRHASQESVSINNLDSGRHSPDMFAHLSARFIK